MATSGYGTAGRNAGVKSGGTVPKGKTKSKVTGVKVSPKGKAKVTKSKAVSGKRVNPFAK